MTAEILRFLDFPYFVGEFFWFFFGRFVKKSKNVINSIDKHKFVVYNRVIEKNYIEARLSFFGVTAAREVLIWENPIGKIRGKTP